MKTIYRYNGRDIRRNRAWTDDNGIQHPSNWHVWSEEKKEEMGITEVVLQSFPNQMLYSSTHNADGSVNSVERNIDLVKERLKSTCVSAQEGLLSQHDWAYIRKIDKGTAIPTAIQTFRDAVRTSATSIETAIDNAADTSAIETLISEGTLNDWPDYMDIVAAELEAAEAEAARIAAEAEAARIAAEAEVVVS